MKKSLMTAAILGAAFVAPRSTEAAGEFVWPVTGWLSATTVYPGGADHQGASADIAAPMRTPIGASRFGSSGAFWEGGGCGNYAWVTHESGYITLYCHMVSRPATGRLATNQTLGYIGMTGNTTGPHVHWAIRRYGVRRYVPGSYIGMRVSRGAPVAGNYGLSRTTSSGSTTTGSSSQSDSNGAVVFRVKVTGTGINVRSSPGTSATRVGGLAQNSIWNVYGLATGNWFKIWFNGAWRWFKGDWTTRVLPSVRTTDALNIRSGPGTNYARVGGLDKGNVVAVFGTSGSWLKILMTGGTYRWIMGTYTQRL